MRTSLSEKVKHIERGSEISGQLAAIFGREAPITICDIGACDGLETIIYARLFTKARLFAFEARADVYAELVDNLKTFSVADRVTTYNVCLSDESGETDWYESYGDSGNKKEWNTGDKSSSILPPDAHLDIHKWCRFNRKRIQIQRFDAIPGVPTEIDFIHIDVQGAERKVLDGMGGIFKSVKVIWMEVANVPLYRRQPLKIDMAAFMTTAGFQSIVDTCHRNSGDMLWIRG